MTDDRKYLERCYQKPSHGSSDALDFIVELCKSWKKYRTEDS